MQVTPRPQVRLKVWVLAGSRKKAAEGCRSPKRKRDTGAGLLITLRAKPGGAVSAPSQMSG